VYPESNPPRSTVFVSRIGLRDAAFASRMHLRDVAHADSYTSSVPSNSFLPRSKGRGAFCSFRTLPSLFASRAFHNSFTIKQFRTLSENSRVYPNSSYSGLPRAVCAKGTRHSPFFSRTLRSASAKKRVFCAVTPLFATLAHFRGEGGLPHGGCTPRIKANSKEWE
jgi:hypothetical protein